MPLQSGWSGCRTGNRKKLSSSQAQLGQATYLAVALFISISCATYSPSTLYKISVALHGGIARYVCDRHHRRRRLRPSFWDKSCGFPGGSASLAISIHPTRSPHSEPRPVVRAVRGGGKSRKGRKELTREEGRRLRRSLIQLETNLLPLDST